MGNPRVLVVDDETTICHVLDRYLTSKGAQVRTAHSGEDALRLVQDAAPEVVLLDIVLPGMNGVQTLTEIKRISPATQVVMMTSFSSVDSAVEAIRNGAFDYLHKPFNDINEVWSIVQRALAGDRDETIEQPAAADSERPRPEILVVDDEESIRHVLLSILEMKDCMVREAGSTEEAIDVLKDWEPAVALVDIVLPGKSGIAFLGEIKRAYPDTEVLMMTSKASAETAVKAIRLGAYDYLRKPFELEEVWSAVQRSLEKHNLNVKNRAFSDRQEEKRRQLTETVELLAQPEAEVDPEILDEFLGLICRELDVDRACLMLLDAESSELRTRASRGLPDGSDSEAVDPGRGITGSVVESGEPYLWDSTSASRPADGARPGDPSSFLGDAPIAMSVPIKTQHDILGTVNVAPRSGDIPFGPEELSYLGRMAGQIAVTIDGSRRADQLQKAYESLKSTQRQLVFSERIKAVGQMAAGVAHDFNNVLSVILARAQSIDLKLRSGEFDTTKTLEHTATIIQTALQGAEAIKRIQDYTRIRKDVARAPVDLNLTIHDAVEIAKPKWNREAASQGQGIQVRMDLGEIPNVSGNRYELAQVFGNLIFNAVEAMPDGGTLSFRTYCEGKSVIVDVTDSGTGMDEETRKHLFEPFFTTKKSGQGLGTSILFGIVGRHGGEIDVESEIGRGTTFRVKFPRAERQAESVVNVAADPGDAKDATARVLLVEDDELVRETYEEVLRAMGHEVAACAAAEEALAVLGHQTFDVVITDMSMKGMTGLDLTRWIKADHPEVAVVLSSGWAISEDSPEVAEAGVDFVLMKPVMVDDLLSTVARAARRSFVS